MDHIDRKTLVARTGHTISSLARKFGCNRKQLSMCINGERPYRLLRKKLARFLSVSEDELFSQPDQASKHKAA